jgi:hypothetical protein
MRTSPKSLNLDHQKQARPDALTCDVSGKGISRLQTVCAGLFPEF